MQNAWKRSHALGYLDFAEDHFKSRSDASTNFICDFEILADCVLHVGESLLLGISFCSATWESWAVDAKAFFGVNENYL